MSCRPINKPLVKSGNRLSLPLFFFLQFTDGSGLLLCCIFPCSFLPSTLTHIPVPALVQVSGFFPPPGQWCGRWHQHPLTLHVHEEKIDQRPVRPVKTNPQSPISPTQLSLRKEEDEREHTCDDLTQTPGFSLFIPRTRYHNIFIQVASR